MDCNPGSSDGGGVLESVVRRRMESDKIECKKDYTAKVWDAETGTELMTLKGHEDSVRSVAYSPDGQRIKAVKCLLRPMPPLSADVLPMTKR